ncbi:MAG TPA: aminotransferase class I/II-fold pyridoxal phosphate-dependent enzyme [Streptosporangiaceae bacterium]|jgi:cystathionine beta-lyase|nr:aminotransferase class I/II-fold pyridoxal phosphate-dependent enzyme [Streptosporangiaceae bacterium]
MPSFDDLDLDQLRGRTGMKWAVAEPGVLPAWVADMDFPIPPRVREAIIRCVDTDLGYPIWTDSGEGMRLAEAFAERMERRYGFAPDPAYVRTFTDVHQALQVILHIATRPGDPVAVHVPAYPPFLETLASMGRPLLPIPMLETADGWGFDADRLAADIARLGCRVLLLVNPQNPTGRAFRRAELLEVAEIALAHDLLVISDEIHADLVYEPGTHLPFASLGAEIAERTVTVTSATKAFNLAGIRCAVAHIGERHVREAIAAQPKFLFGEVGVLGVVATLAAWLESDDWLAEVMTVLDRNRHRLLAALPPRVTGRLPEATYLAWLDCRALDLGPDPVPFFRERAGVLVSGGPPFGPGGAGFTRVNFATSGPILDEILSRMSEAVIDRDAAALSAD